MVFSRPGAGHAVSPGWSRGDIAVRSAFCNTMGRLPVDQVDPVGLRFATRHGCASPTKQMVSGTVARKLEPKVESQPLATVSVGICEQAGEADNRCRPFRLADYAKINDAHLP
jgi:hypothetical protein